MHRRRRPRGPSARGTDAPPPRAAPRSPSACACCATSVDQRATARRTPPRHRPRRPPPQRAHRGLGAASRRAAGCAEQRLAASWRRARVPPARRRAPSSSPRYHRHDRRASAARRSSRRPRTAPPASPEPLLAVEHRLRPHRRRPRAARRRCARSPRWSRARAAWNTVRRVAAARARARRRATGHRLRAENAIAAERRDRIVRRLLRTAASRRPPCATPGDMVGDGGRTAATSPGRCRNRRKPWRPNRLERALTAHEAARAAKRDYAAATIGPPAAGRRTPMAPPLGAPPRRVNQLCPLDHLRAPARARARRRLGRRRAPPPPRALWRMPSRRCDVASSPAVGAARARSGAASPRRLAGGLPQCERRRRRAPAPRAADRGSRTARTALRKRRRRYRGSAAPRRRRSPRRQVAPPPTAAARLTARHRAITSGALGAAELKLLDAFGGRLSAKIE